MIIKKDNYFVLHSKSLSYVFSVLKTGHLEHLYLGKKLSDDSDFSVLHTKITAGAGSLVYYDQTSNVALDLLPLEYSSIGKGDYRHLPFEAKMPNGSFVADFIYDSYEIVDGIYKSELPQALAYDKKVKSLIINLVDKTNDCKLSLVYTVFYETDSFTRRIIITNNNQNTLILRKVMSMMLDLNESDYDLITFDGGWIKEANKHIRPLSYGTYTIESITGSSSNRHNPGFIVSKKGTHEDYGVCLGFNLVYSGNHYSAVSISNHGQMRIMSGINPFCFEWPLEKNESFETPEVVISYSNEGYNKLSQNMHDFVNNHIIPKEYQKSLRPIVINDWEAFMFDFNERKLLKLMNQAKKIGVEMFVLDDGWFANRNDDTKGLGDYYINKKKLKRGLAFLANKANKKGLKFGLWFEPEMVNENSKLYATNPNYAVKIDNLNPSLGRNQLVLDLCNKEVREYIKENVFNIIDSANISYIKWDMNRHISDMYSKTLKNQGMFYHEYIKGLYEILTELKNRYPNILLESCSSGGNRFDLGMLTFSPQIWASDNTDPITRLSIQEGLSYLYPLSTISAHVSMAPHAQTLRDTPLTTRYHVASFGVLGYELDFKLLKPYELKMIKEQIIEYKENREVFQFGKFYRFNHDDNHISFQVSYENKHIFGKFLKLANASPNLETLRIKGLDSDKHYHVRNLYTKLPLTRFGHLIKHALPIKLKHDGFIMRNIARRVTLDNAKEEYYATGSMLLNGISMKQQFMGTYYNQDTRLIGDFGSEMYLIKEVDNEN